MARFRKFASCAALAGCALLASLDAQAQVASFDCSQASNAAERAICATPALGRKDVTVATYYDVLLRLKPAVSGMAYREFDDRIRAEQRRWLVARRDACKGDIACLQRAYDERTDELKKALDSNAGLTFGHLID